MPTHAIAYTDACAAVAAYRGQRGSMQFVSLADSVAGNELLLLRAALTQTAWLDSATPTSLRRSDGSAVTITEIIDRTLAAQAQAELLVAGYFSYELAHSLEQLPPLRPSTTNLPDVFVACYDTWLEIDHDTKTAQFVCGDNLSAAALLTHIEQDIPLDFNCHAGFRPSESRQHYHANIETILAYINAGDCYQINYAQHFSTPYSGNSYSAFRAIANAITAPYAGYINTGFGELLSFSPEQFIHVDTQRTIRTRPIKGTAKRNSDSVADAQAANTLMQSDKNRAENLMIVDLLRHDLGKSCELGSIQVEELFALQSFTNVHHLVSTISGVLSQSCTPLGAMLAAYPGGSITGAPKIRAMEIINQLERQRRSAYCGSMFYQKPDGSFDSNIMIRTLVATNNTLHCWGGGGIVADSVAELEYQETLDKVGVYMQIIERLSQPT